MNDRIDPPWAVDLALAMVALEQDDPARAARMLSRALRRREWRQAIAIRTHAVRMGIQVLEKAIGRHRFAGKRRTEAGWHFHAKDASGESVLVAALALVYPQTFDDLGKPALVLEVSREDLVDMSIVDAACRTHEGVMIMKGRADLYPLD